MNQSLRKGLGLTSRWRYCSKTCWRPSQIWSNAALAMLLIVLHWVQIELMLIYCSSCYCFIGCCWSVIEFKICLTGVNVRTTVRSYWLLLMDAFHADHLPVLHLICKYTVIYFIRISPCGNDHNCKRTPPHWHLCQNSAINFLDLPWLCTNISHNSLW